MRCCPRTPSGNAAKALQCRALTSSLSSVLPPFPASSHSATRLWRQCAATVARYDPLQHLLPALGAIGTRRLPSYTHTISAPIDIPNSHSLALAFVPATNSARAALPPISTGTRTLSCVFIVPPPHTPDPYPVIVLVFEFFLFDMVVLFAIAQSRLLYRN